MGIVSWFLIMPLGIAAWIVVGCASACAKRERAHWRLLGLVISLLIGGTCVMVGREFGIIGFTETEWEGLAYRQVQVTYPVFGWIAMIGGGLMGLAGTWTALVGTRAQIEQQEEDERLERELKRLEQEAGKET